MRFRWNRVVLIVLPVGAIVLFPLWHRWLNPDFYADVRCIKPGVDEAIVLTSGEECGVGSE